LRRSRSLAQLQNLEEDNEIPLKKLFEIESTISKFPVDTTTNRLASSHEIPRDDKPPPRPLFGPPSQEPKPTNKCKSYLKKKQEIG